VQLLQPALLLPLSRTHHLQQLTQLDCQAPERQLLLLLQQQHSQGLCWNYLKEEHHVPLQPLLLLLL
jgi:hypothetical protein